jgi:hypothetical protein
MRFYWNKNCCFVPEISSFMGHIDPKTLLVYLAVGFAVRSVALFLFLTMMIKIQKLDFVWLPLIGSTLLASALDLIPLVGHFVAVPALYLCIWKWARCDSVKDATFTVGISYALVTCLTWILLSYAPVNLPKPTASQDNFSFDNTPTAKQVAITQPTKNSDRTLAVAQPAQDTAPTDAVATDNSNVATPAISVTGVIRSPTGAMVTIQCGKKDYMLSQDEGVTISTDQGTVPVHFVEASGNEVTLSVGGQEKKYALK